MFTGIIEAVGFIESTRKLGGGCRFTISAPFSSELRPDQSVAVNGTCLTVVQTDSRGFDVEAIEETLRKTTLGTFRPGTRVNLERAMRPDGRLDGHLVQGHVDTTGSIVSMVEETTGRLYTVQFDLAYSSHVIPVGSIAVDGISLTVARLEADRFTVAIIPHTYTHTNVSDWKPGRTVNLEFDLIGKYVARHLDRTRHASGAPGITAERLRELGYE
jgi:riboflavin synthase